MESDAPGPQELVEGMTGRGRVVQEGSVDEETPTVFCLNKDVHTKGYGEIVCVYIYDLNT